VVPSAHGAGKLRVTLSSSVAAAGSDLRVVVRPALRRCTIRIHRGSRSGPMVLSRRLPRSGRIVVPAGSGAGARVVVVRCGRRRASAMYSVLVGSHPAVPAVPVAPPVAPPSLDDPGGDVVTDSEEPGHGELDPSTIPEGFEAAETDTGGAAPGFRIPFPCNERWRTSTYRGHSPSANAIDWNDPVRDDGGRAVAASAPGTVFLAPAGQWNGGYGNYVVVNHGGGWSTLYAHLRGYAVTPGQSVGQGQVIGYVGTTGSSTGNHLHYEQRLNRVVQPGRWSGGGLAFGVTYTSDNCPPAPTPSPTPPQTWGGVGGLIFKGSDSLGNGQQLNVNEYILSNDVRTFTVMQSDGNLVVYGPGGRALWASNTAGSGANRAVMQGDGNLVLYRANGTPVWASQTAGQGASRLVVQDDANLVAYRLSDGRATWASGRTIGYGLQHVATQTISNRSLTANQYVRSLDKRYALVMQGDGNLVLYGAGYHALWHTGTGGNGGARAVMQGDGNLVVYRADGQPLWASNTAGSHSNLRLTVQDDGNLVIYNSAGALWSSGTGGKI
jgi:hypothetical protein